MLTFLSEDKPPLDSVRAESFACFLERGHAFSVSVHVDAALASSGKDKPFSSSQLREVLFVCFPSAEWSRTSFFYRVGSPDCPDDISYIV